MAGWDNTQLLSGKKALIIGGGGEGIGRSIGEAMVGVGAEVALTDLDAERVESAVLRLSQGGGKAMGIVADVLDNADITRMVSEARSALGGIDIVVTVVGGQTSKGLPYAPLHKFTAAQIERALGVNIGYVMQLLRETIPVMLEQGRGGAIVGVGSIGGGPNGAPNQAVYGASKAALSSLARSIAGECGYAGIRMNVVAPGAVETPSTPRNADELGAILHGVPLGRRATPSDVADAVVFLASDLSGYITGETLLVDGGMTTRLLLP